MSNIRTKNEAKRQQILMAATQLFTEQGYAAVSMDKIASLANVSKQTVYSHFGNKDELFSASIRNKCESYHILDLSHSEVSDPHQTLIQFAEGFIDMLLSKEALAIHRICCFESTANPQISELFYEAGPRRIVAEVKEFLTRLGQATNLTFDNPHFSAIQLLNLIKGEVLMQAEFNIKQRVSDDEVKEYLHSAIALFLKGHQ